MNDERTIGDVLFHKVLTQVRRIDVEIAVVVADDQVEGDGQRRDKPEKPVNNGHGDPDRVPDLASLRAALKGHYSIQDVQDEEADINKHDIAEVDAIEPD